MSRKPQNKPLHTTNFKLKSLLVDAFIWSSLGTKDKTVLSLSRFPSTRPFEDHGRKNRKTIKYEIETTKLSSIFILNAFVLQVAARLKVNTNWIDHFSSHCARYGAAVVVHIYFGAQNSPILNLTANSPILLANSSISPSTTIIVFARFFSWRFIRYPFPLLPSSYFTFNIRETELFPNPQK